MGSYCGADGVDEWDEERWKEEISKNQVNHVLRFCHCSSGARSGSPSLPGSDDPLLLLAFRCCTAHPRRVSSRSGANSNPSRPQPN